MFSCLFYVHDLCKDKYEVEQDRNPFSAYSSFLNHFPKVVPKGAMTKKAPPTMLPRVTGIRFFTNISLTVISAPLKIARGIMNMLATEWSRPRATKALMGNQTAVIFPTKEVQPDAM
mmetsp:Transcript_29488/g.43893  ORF Transcript_29488/g.43893 Transcript_29488/m.43893 type:complete len:117 (-) Transcript_29488:726-1076(-)